MIALRYLIGILILICTVVLAQNNARERIVYPTDFRRTMSLYSTIDRADGKVYEIFINRTALEIWRLERRLPHGTQFVIESFNAQRNASGVLLRDARGRLLKGASDNEIHVSEKRNDWTGTEQTTLGNLFGTPTQNERWRMAAFDPRDGKSVAVNIAECHQCHQDSRAEDFNLSRGLLDGFVRSGQPSYIAFTCEKREICFGTAR
jgi:hypothetical protein